MKNLFWENFVTQCEKLEKSPTTVVEELGFKRPAVTSWKNGALPQVKNRKKIADYFGITVEELMGTKKEPAGEGELTEDMKEILEYAQKMGPDERKAFITLLKSNAKK
nr:MAG TPA: regulatory protein/DNA complex-sensing repressor [Caudoviricetes sp.]